MERIGNPSFGKWLKKRRKAFDLTQVELARRVGCAAITLQKIEANKRLPSKQLTILLASHLGVPKEEFPEFIEFARAKPHSGQFEPFGQATGRRASWNFLRNCSTNLPVPPTPLIGRDHDVAASRKRLLEGSVRLLTLVDPPGVGKTRLGIQIGSSLLDEFSDGVYFVSLASVNDPDMVPAAIAQTLGVNQIGEWSFAERLQEYLRDKQMLLVLDNFEQILMAARFIADLLSICASLCILITSRAPLSIRIEHQFQVRPLALPDELSIDTDPSDLTRYPAIELFIERAQAADPGFALTPENAKIIISLCIRLDGLPLAIELVAARARFIPPSSLLEQLNTQDFLHLNGLRDLDERHQTLYRAIDWSYALLKPDEQLFLACLSVFHRGWTLAAVERIMNDQTTANIPGMLESLISCHLVMPY